MHYINPTLTDTEKRVILHKWTEKPYTGEFRDTKTSGTYICRNCKTPLYRSVDKFDSGCGRPSFDQQLPGAVRRDTDADGMRTEITCAHCGWHLWHVFVGEKMTEHNTRHCVNSISLQLVPEIITTTPYDIITLWWWCFRCTQAVFDDIDGIIQTTVGYSGGKRSFPSYEQICTGATGHHEVVQIIFDPEKILLEKLLEMFFKIHDPTSRDKQGWDSGTQYRSVIFCQDTEQLKKTKEFIQTLAIMYKDPIVTEVKLLEKFRIAEWYHQHFFQKNPEKPYCQMVIKPKIATITSTI